MSQAARHFSLRLELHFSRHGQRESRGTETHPYVSPAPIFLQMFHHSLSTCCFVLPSGAKMIVGAVTFHTQSRVLSSKPERVFITVA